MRRVALLVGGCVVLGAGVAMLLLADLGSDGYSTLVNGIRLALDLPFIVANVAVSVSFLALAWVRRLPPGLGTLAQVVLVGVTVSVLLDVFDTPSSLVGQYVLLALAIPVLTFGIAAYLGAQAGAGPGEAAALAWDPPIPFKWSYSAVQGGGALVGWLLGSAIGVGTIVVIFLLGPAVDLCARLLRVETTQPRS